MPDDLAAVEVAEPSAPGPVETVYVTGVDVKAFVGMVAKIKPWAREPYEPKCQPMILRVGALPRLELFGVCEDADRIDGKAGFAVRGELAATVVNELDFAAIDAIKLGRLIGNATGEMTISRIMGSFGCQVLRLRITPPSETGLGRKKKRVTANYYDMGEIECPRAWMQGGDKSTPGRPMLPQFIDACGPVEEHKVTLRSTTLEPGGALQAALGKALPCMGDDAARAQCQQIFVGSADPNECRDRTMILATDGHRAVRTYLDVESPFGPGTPIPGELVKILIKAREPARVSWASWDGGKIMQGSPWWRVTVGSLTWTLARNIDNCGTLPPILQIIGNTSNGVEFARTVVSASSMLALLAQAATMNSITLSFRVVGSADANDALELSAANPEIGVMSGELPVIESTGEYDGRLNIEYVTEAVKATANRETDTIEIRFDRSGSEISPVYFVGADQEVLIMPMRK